MPLLEILLLAVGLSMDAVAVSLGQGLCMPVMNYRTAWRLAGAFGVFQMLMPVLGWLAGLAFRTLIASFDHWVAFLLLAAIGVKMIHEAREETCCEKGERPLTWLLLLGLALATSIDALAVGLSFSFLKMNITTPVLIIGAVTFTLSFAAVRLGHRFGAMLGRRMEVVGGLILIGIGLKIFLSHQFGWFGGVG